MSVPSDFFVSSPADANNGVAAGKAFVASAASLRDAAEHGLYRPEGEHDACGVGFVAHIKGRKAHDIVQQATRQKDPKERSLKTPDAKVQCRAYCNTTRHSNRIIGVRP